nr:MAG: hypothetical protein [Bacteriophage sp.]
MKGLQFLGNRVEDAANAFIDVPMIYQYMPNVLVVIHFT